MIAAAMPTRNPPTPSYRDLARTSAVIDRQLAPGDLVRLREQTGEVGPVQARLRFGIDSHGRMCVTGRVSTLCSLPCQWCLEPRPFDLVADLNAALAVDEAQADRWLGEGDAAPDNVIVVAGEVLNPVELVEDELLLNLPNQVCTDATCEFRPAAAYGTDPEVTGENGIGEDLPSQAGPFAALARLRNGGARQGEDK